MVECKIKNCYNDVLEGSVFCADCQLERDDNVELSNDWGMGPEDQENFR